MLKDKKEEDIQSFWKNFNLGKTSIYFLIIIYMTPRIVVKSDSHSGNGFQKPHNRFFKMNQ